MTALVPYPFWAEVAFRELLLGVREIHRLLGTRWPALEQQYA